MYANFAYMQNLHTYANLVMCTRLKKIVVPNILQFSKRSLSKVIDLENIGFVRKMIVVTILDSFFGIVIQCRKRGVTKRRQNKTWDLTSRTFRSNDTDSTNRKLTNYSN